MDGGVKFFSHIKSQSMSFSNTTIVGYLGQDCQTRTLDGGRVVTSFSVAFTESWKNQAGEKQERTTWFNCSYFTANTPGVADYLGKGSLVCVTGRVSARAYMGQNNQPAASLELNVQEIKLLSTPRRNEQPAPTALPHPDSVLGSNKNVITQSANSPADGDDLPF